MSTRFDTFLAPSSYPENQMMHSIKRNKSIQNKHEKSLGTKER